MKPHVCQFRCKRDVSIHISDEKEMKLGDEATIIDTSRVSIHISDEKEMKLNRGAVQGTFYPVSIHISDEKEMKLGFLGFKKTVRKFQSTSPMKRR